MKRKMTTTDVRQITELVTEHYRNSGARGKPIVEVGQKYKTGTRGFDELFWDHNGVEDGTFDLYDNWLLRDVRQMSSKGEPELQVYPGFSLDLYVYTPERRQQGQILELGELWGNLDAVWTGERWDVFCPFERRKQEGKVA